MKNRKKSLLWTAAGVVSATALWAALSLPHPQPQSPPKALWKAVPAPRHMAPPFIRRTTQVTITNEDGSQIVLNELPEPAQVEWTGRYLTLLPQRIHILTNRTGASTTLTILRQTSETRPGYLSCSSSQFTKTLQPGERLRF
jgi:hypothetical protein